MNFFFVLRENWQKIIKFHKIREEKKVYKGNPTDRDIQLYRHELQSDWQFWIYHQQALTVFVDITSILNDKRGKKTFDSILKWNDFSFNQWI